MSSSVVLGRMGPSALESTALPVFQPECSVLGWLESRGRFSGDVPILLGGLCARLLESGVPLHRVNVILRTLHPLVLVSGYVWRAPGEVDTFEAGHESMSGDQYLKSPVRKIFDGSRGIRRRLMDPGCPRDFPILDDLDREGVTDYVILPLQFSDGRSYAASWATTAPCGFSDGDVARIVGLMQPLAMALEIRSVRDIAANLMATYLGHKTGERVLNGAILRGSTETLDAVIWYSDLRGFTRMADRLPTPVLLDILNDHFERVAGPVQRHGGEVLKFVGDGVLAIFPVDELGGASAAAAAALDSVDESLRLNDEINIERRERDAPEITFGVALHLGAVTYGNIGAPDRLDFTVIGPAVNHATRIEGQCRTMDRQVLASAAVAEASDRPLVSLGVHALKGIREPQELFTLAPADG